MTEMHVSGLSVCPTTRCLGPDLLMWELVPQLGEQQIVHLIFTGLQTS